MCKYCSWASLILNPALYIIIDPKKNIPYNSSVPRGVPTSTVQTDRSGRPAETRERTRVDTRREIDFFFMFQTAAFSDEKRRWFLEHEYLAAARRQRLRVHRERSIGFPVFTDTGRTRGILVILVVDKAAKWRDAISRCGAARRDREVQSCGAAGSSISRSKAEQKNNNNIVLCHTTRVTCIGIIVVVCRQYCTRIPVWRRDAR